MQVSVELSQASCAQCGVAFAVPTNLSTSLRENHTTFYCPNGHPNYYPSKSASEKLNDTLSEAKNQIQKLQGENRKLARQNKKLSK